LETICLGWLWNTILLISASRVARITGVSHRHPAFLYYFKRLKVFKILLQTQITSKDQNPLMFSGKSTVINQHQVQRKCSTLQLLRKSKGLSTGVFFNELVFSSKHVYINELLKKYLKIYEYK
jgi:hypothetical protein